MSRTTPAWRIAAWALAALAAGQGARAALTIDARAEGRFRQLAEHALATLRGSPEPVFRKLVQTVETCGADVTIRAITDDPRTWHPDGNRERGHADPVDRQPKRGGRDKPTAAWLYVPMSAVDPQGQRWASGVLVHELVHAMDLACGRYHRDGSVRERRAVWVQNLWRHRLGQPLRVSYHGQFATLDFQHGLKTGRSADYERHLFERADFPAAPSGN